MTAFCLLLSAFRPLTTHCSPLFLERIHTRPALHKGRFRFYQTEVIVVHHDGRQAAKAETARAAR